MFLISYRYRHSHSWWLIVLAGVLALLIACPRRHDDTGSLSEVVLASNHLLSELPTTTEWRFVLPAESPGRDKTIRLEETNCSCLSVSSMGRERKRGDEWVVPHDRLGEVLLTSRNDRRPGRHDVFARVSWPSDDGERRSFYCRAQSNVFPDISIEPPAIIFSVQQHRAAPARKTVRVNHAYHGLSTEDANPIVTLPPGFSVEKSHLVERKIVRSLDADANVPEITVDCWDIAASCQQVAQASSDQFEGGVHFVLATGANQYERLPIIVRQVEGIRAPRVMALGNLLLDEESTRTMVFHSADGRPFRVSQLKCDSEIVEARLKESNDAVRKQHTVPVLVRGCRVGEFREKLIFGTDHPACETIQVDVTGRVHSEENMP